MREVFVPPGKPLVRAEIVSPNEFAIVLEGARSPKIQETIVAELEIAAGGAVTVRTQLDESDRCHLDAYLYANLNHALLAAGRGNIKGLFFWVPLLPWVVGSLPTFGGNERGDVAPPEIWLPKGMMPYQELGVRRSLIQRGRVLLADEMGLGKTLQALTVVAHYLEEQGPALVVAPSSLGSVWRDQAKRWLPKLRQSEVQLITSTKEQPLVQSKIVIVSYALFARSPDTYSRTSGGEDWQIVVCDEAHYLRNPSSQRAKALLPVLHNAHRAVLVTGTPTPKQASEAFVLLHALRPMQCSFKEWCDRYGSGRTEHRETEVAALLAEVMVRRLKADVLDQLPPKHRQRIELSIPASASAIVKKLQAEAQAGGHVDDEEHFRQLARVKEVATQDYVEYLLDASSVKFILFAHHISMLDAFSKTLHKRDVDFIRIDGSTPVQERSQLVNQFQTQASCRAAVLSVVAAGEGLTLTAASICVFCELCPAVPGTIEQAEARVHRIGQKASHVDIHFLIVEGTRDDQVFARLETRETEVGRVLGKFEPDEKECSTALDSLSKILDESAPTIAPAKKKATSTQAPKAKRRKPTMDLGSLLDGEINRVQAEFSNPDTVAGSSRPQANAEFAKSDNTSGSSTRQARASEMVTPPISTELSVARQDVPESTQQRKAPKAKGRAQKRRLRPIGEGSVGTNAKKGTDKAAIEDSDDEMLSFFASSVQKPAASAMSTLPVPEEAPPLDQEEHREAPQEEHNPGTKTDMDF